jgi:hypothetical protein
MAISKSERGISVRFGEFYIGSYQNMLGIVDDWLELIVRKPDKNYLERLEDFNSLVLRSVTPSKPFMVGVDTGTFHIINIVWFFSYRPNGIPKELIAKFIERYNASGISAVIDIMRPHQKPMPELDTEKITAETKNIHTELGKPLSQIEKREYKKNLKYYKEFMGWYDEVINVVNMQLQMMNLKFEPTQLSHVESNMSDLKNQIRQLETEIKTLKTKVEGKVPEYLDLNSQ